MNTVSVWRIGKTFGKYLARDLSGGGAAAAGGRFNSKGNAVVYTSASVSLAMLETLVHLGVTARAESNRYLVEILLPADVFERRTIWTVDEFGELCPDWDAIPFAENSQKIGDAWLTTGNSAVLQVPSSIVPHPNIPDVNFLLNPAHPDMKLVQVKMRQKVIYDPRFGT